MSRFDHSSFFVYDAPSAFFINNVGGQKMQISKLLKLCAVAYTFMLAAGKDKPGANDPFAVHKAWVDDLPSKGCPSELNLPLNELRVLENPFNYKPMPYDTTTLTIEKFDYDEQFGVATHREKTFSHIDGRESIEKDEHKVIIGGLGNEGPVTFQFEMTKDGSLKPTSKEHKSVEAYKEELNNEIGVVASTQHKDYQGTCYTAYKKPKP